MTAAPSLVPSLTFVHRPDVVTSEDALRVLAGAAVAQGYAADTFPAALDAREKAYPTGLPLPVPVAIPHTDAVHVLRPGIAALVPAKPIAFGEMGNKDRSVAAELVLLLLVDDPKDQVALLGALISALQRPNLHEALLQDVVGPQDLVRRFDALMSNSALS